MTHKTIFTTIFLLTQSLSLCYAQGITFSGVLKSSENEEPIEHALLYIDGTTFGVTSDENGEFEFENLSFPVRIEISHLSYEPKSVLIENSRMDDPIHLNPRAIRLREVLILNKGTRKDYIKKFNKWFIGNDQWGQRAKLLNDSALVFFDITNGFRVGASEPLIIESRGLGYTIRADLRDFLVEKDSSGSETWSFVSSYHFTASQKKKFHRNRARAYYNSVQHFLKSLYDTKISQNGYEIKKKIINDSPGRSEYATVSIDSNLVWKEDNKRIITGLKDNEFFIQYYYKENGFPKDLEKNQPSMPYKSSAIKFTKNEIILRSDGTTPGTFIQFSGDIGQKKVGAMLPSNYQPPNTESSPEPTIDTQIPDRLIRKRNN